MKKGLIVVVIALLAIFAYVQIKSSRTSEQVEKMQALTSTATPVKVDYQAGFAIFTHGTFRVFSAAMYHNQSKDVFINAESPNVVHVKKAGTTWGDFFSSLPFNVTSNCLTTGTGETFCTGEEGRLRFYLNGKQTPNLLQQQIQQGDQAVITFGDEEEGKIQKTL